jgi:hypothetical protein
VNSRKNVHGSVIRKLVYRSNINFHTSSYILFFLTEEGAIKRRKHVINYDGKLQVHDIVFVYTHKHDVNEIFMYTRAFFMMMAQYSNLVGTKRNV